MRASSVHLQSLIEEAMRLDGGHRVKLNLSETEPGSSAPDRNQ